MAQAAKLRIEFGEDPNLEKWQLFLATYRNVTTLNDKLKDASQEAKLWTEDKEFRARMIMQQLRGEPLIWLSQDEYTEVLKQGRRRRCRRHRCRGTTFLTKKKKKKSCSNRL